MTRTFIILLVLVLATLTARAEVYKWTDEDGKLHFSDKPPPQGEEFDTVDTPWEPRDMVSVRRAGPERKPRHFFLNHYGGPAEIELSLAGSENVRSEPPLPARFVLPGQVDTPLVSFHAEDETLAFNYRLHYKLVPGPPLSELPPTFDYYPPFARGQKFPISQGLDDDSTHMESDNRYAIDIAMPIGTPVLAARGGVIMDFEDDHRGEGKQDKRYLSRANYVRVLHDDGSMGVYAHLQADSARVRAGMRVNEGHWLANSGNTGYSSGPHLHFVVQMNIGMALESLPFSFRVPGGGVMDPDHQQMLSGVLPAPSP
jgi:murein DD-endopeptidase MepM/ murein hydrolase activator NlpD